VETGKLTFGMILQTVFRNINETPSMLAEFYIDRDRTLVYKWMRDTASPAKKLVPEIIRFIVENTGEPARIKIKSELDKVIAAADFPVDLKNALLGSPDFENYLNGMIALALTKRKDEAAPKPLDEPSGEPGSIVIAPSWEPDRIIFTSSGDSDIALPAPTEVSSSAVPVQIGESDNTALAPSGEFGSAVPAKSDDSGSTVPVTNIVFAVLAATVGGLLWSFVANALGLLYAMGRMGREPTGFMTFFWGICSLSPVIICAAISLWREKPTAKSLCGPGKAGYIIAYTLACGIGGLLFYGSGFGGFIEKLNIGHVLQEITYVFVLSLVLSFLPVLAVLLLMRFPKMKPSAFIFIEFFPAAMCVSAVMILALVNQPEVSQLRVFLIGFIMRLAMYITIRIVLRGYPDDISIDARSFRKSSSTGN